MLGQSTRMRTAKSVRAVILISLLSFNNACFDAAIPGQWGGLTVALALLAALILSKSGSFILKSAQLTEALGKHHAATHFMFVVLCVLETAILMAFDADGAGASVLLAVCEELLLFTVLTICAAFGLVDFRRSPAAQTRRAASFAIGACSPYLANLLVGRLGGLSSMVVLTFLMGACTIAILYCRLLGVQAFDMLCGFLLYLLLDLLLGNAGLETLEIGTTGLLSVESALTALGIGLAVAALCLRGNGNAHGSEDARVASSPPDAADLTQTLEDACGEQLTPRQRQLLTAAIQGKNNRQMADHLGIALGTVAACWPSIYKKLGVTGRKSLLRLIGDGNQRECGCAEHGYARMGLGKCMGAGLPLAIVLFAALFKTFIASKEFGMHCPRLIWFAAGICLIAGMVGFSSDNCRHARPLNQNRGEARCGLDLFWPVVVYELLWLVWSGDVPEYVAPVACCFVFVCFGSCIVAKGLNGLLSEHKSGLYDCGGTRAKAKGVLVRGLQSMIDPQSTLVASLTLLTSAYVSPLLSSMPTACQTVVWLPSIWLIFICFMRIIDSFFDARLTQKAPQNELSVFKELGFGELQAAVLLDTANGFSETEICARRQAALSTVKSYRQRGYRRLGVHSSSELSEFLDSHRHNR